MFENTNQAQLLTAPNRCSYFSRPRVCPLVSIRGAAADCCLDSLGRSCPPLPPSSPSAAADCCLGRLHPPSSPPSPSAVADCCLGRRQEAPASPLSPARRLIVIWVVWSLYLPPSPRRRMIVIWVVVLSSLLPHLTWRLVIWVVVP